MVDTELYGQVVGINVSDCLLLNQGVDTVVHACIWTLPLELEVVPVSRPSPAIAKVQVDGKFQSIAIWVYARRYTVLPSRSQGCSFLTSNFVANHTERSNEMPASNVIRGGIFAAGLAVGVGAASLLNRNNPRLGLASTSAPPQAQVVQDEKSTGLVAQGGRPTFTPSRDVAGALAAAAPPSSPSNQLASDVFRYGFPGRFKSKSGV